MSLEIKRIQTEEGIDYMMEYIIADCDETHAELIQVIRDCLSDQPDRTLILQAWEVDKVKEPILQAFIIANAPINGVYAFILQAWKTLKPVDERVMDRLFFRLEFWADSLGKSELRGETTRKTEPFLRKWKFETFSSVLRYKIPENFELRERSDEKNGTSNSTSTDSGSSSGSEENSSKPITDRVVSTGPKTGVAEHTPSVGPRTPTLDPKPAKT